MIVESLIVARAMKSYGGSFVSALAQCILMADSDNLEKIKKAWPEYWEKYLKIGRAMPVE